VLATQRGLTGYVTGRVAIQHLPLHQTVALHLSSGQTHRARRRKRTAGGRDCLPQHGPDLGVWVDGGEPLGCVGPAIKCLSLNIGQRRDNAALL
jgi:hypothetical protein